MEASGIFKFRDNKTYPDPFIDYNAIGSVHNEKERPVIVIDNGKIWPISFIFDIPLYKRFVKILLC